MKKEDAANEEIGQIKETGSILTGGDGPNPIFCLTIIGQIEGHFLLPPDNKTTKYEHIIPQLVAIEQSEEIKGLLIILNTVGGDVEAGLAIAELVAGMKKPTVSLVLGGGHSIGVPLAIAGMHSFIVPSASMIIHPVRLNGTVIGTEQTYNYFSLVQTKIIDFVVEHSGITRDKFGELLQNTSQLANDVGSILYGREAVEAGLIDSLGGLSDALACLHEKIRQNRAGAY